MNKLTFTLLFIAACSILQAQIDRDFWFAIPKETDAHLWCSLTSTNDASFRIAALALPAQVIISMPANPNFVPVILNIPSNTTITYSLTPNLAPNYRANWVAFDSVYANPANFDSRPVNGITNHGIHITSSNDITVYYDYDNFWNRELFSLKGRNALGTEFFTPFQNIWKNDSRSTSPSGNCYTTGTGNSGNPAKNFDAYSEIDIVSSEDRTFVSIYDQNNNILVANIRLEAGQTYSYVAANQTAAAHMTGYRVVSDHPVAVTINDDSVNAGGGGADIIGDQLVPTNILGTQYLVMSGDDGYTAARTAASDRQVPNRNEQVFVVATVDNTRVKFIDTANSTLIDTTINSGKYTFLSPDIRPVKNGTQNTIFVNSSNPIYVFHISGHGYETGGALIPPIDNCRGSYEVTVIPGITGAASGIDTRITMNLMVPYDSLRAFNDTTQAHYHFVLYNTNFPNGFRVPGTWFEPNRITKWAVLSMANRSWGASAPATSIPHNILVCNGANRIVDTVEKFHLGMMNGTDGNTNKYGYFTSFSTVRPQVRIDGTEVQDFFGCLGANVTLVASGGQYVWHYGSPTGPATYLASPTSGTTEVIGLPVGAHAFYVDISNPRCFSPTTLRVNVTILPKPKALFEVDKPTLCTSGTINFKDHSQNADTYQWTKKIDNEPEISFTPANNLSFVEDLNNTTALTQLIRYKLLVTSNSCNDTISKLVTILPVNSQPTPVSFAASEYNLCDSATPVQFTSITSTPISSYQWQFGDGTSSCDANPTHRFHNAGLQDTTYVVQLLVQSNGYCAGNASDKILVYPQVIANFSTVSENLGCNPFPVKFINLSNMPIAERFEWNFGDSISKDSIAPSHTFYNTTANDVFYSVRLTATSAKNCADTFISKIGVHSYIKANFDAAPVEGASPLTVQITNTLLPGISSYAWDYGFGTPDNATGPIITKIYTNTTNADKTYTIQLTVSNPNNCNDVTSRSILVHPEVHTGFMEQSVNGVSSFPNPAKNVVYLKYSLKKSETILIELLDPSGKLIQKITKAQTLGENTTPINIEFYQGHLLFIKAIVDGETVIFKVIKE
jgi:PKD repeat protein